MMKAIILTHLSDPKLGANENLLRVRMAFETVKMEPNNMLKYYYQRFKALKTGYDDTKRTLGLMPVYTAAMTAHEDLLTGMKILKGLNSGYKHYVEYCEHSIKDWPDTLEDAYLEMAKVTPKKQAAANPPNHANVLAVKNAGGEKNAATDKKGKSDGGDGKKGTRPGYGTRSGKCNKCHEPGHYGYECTATDGQAAASAASGKSAN